MQLRILHDVLISSNESPELLLGKEQLRLILRSDLNSDLLRRFHEEGESSCLWWKGYLENSDQESKDPIETFPDDRFFKSGNVLLFEHSPAPGVEVFPSLQKAIDYSAINPRLPNEYLIWDKGFYYPCTRESDPSSEVCRFLNACTLMNILRAQADVIDGNSVTFLKYHKLGIQFNFKTGDLISDIPSKSVQDFVTTAEQHEVRIDIFKATLYDQLKYLPIERRFPSLLKSAEEFALRLVANLAIYLSEHNFEHFKKEFQSKKVELSEKIAKTIIGIEFKGLVVPGTLFLTAKEISLTFDLKSFFIFIAALLISLGMIFLHQTQVALLKQLSEEVQREIKAMSAYVDSDEWTKEFVVKFQGFISQCKFGANLSLVILVLSFLPSFYCLLHFFKLFFCD